MQVWKRFDKDRSGYIEADELKVSPFDASNQQTIGMQSPVNWM